jgi:hypothetical protein
MMDVTDAILDPQFCEKIMVQRRTQSVGTSGLASQSITLLPAYGVITQGGMQDYALADDAERSRILITAHLTIPLRGPASGKAPDQLLWKGNTYTVRKALNYSQYGAGFYAAELEMQDLLEDPNA